MDMHIDETRRMCGAKGKTQMNFERVDENQH